MMRPLVGGEDSNHGEREEEGPIIIRYKVVRLEGAIEDRP